MFYIDCLIISIVSYSIIKMLNIWLYIFLVPLNLSNLCFSPSNLFFIFWFRYIYIYIRVKVNFINQSHTSMRKAYFEGDQKKYRQ